LRLGKALDLGHLAVELLVDRHVGLGRRGHGDLPSGHAVSLAQVENRPDDFRSRLTGARVVEGDPQAVDPEGNQLAECFQHVGQLFAGDSAGDRAVDEHRAAMVLVDHAFHGGAVDRHAGGKAHRGLALGHHDRGLGPGIVAYVGKVDPRAHIGVHGPRHEVMAQDRVRPAAPGDARPIAHGGGADHARPGLTRCEIEQHVGPVDHASRVAPAHHD
jgi:hypothetical protein